MHRVEEGSPPPPPDTPSRPAGESPAPAAPLDRTKVAAEFKDLASATNLLLLALMAALLLTGLFGGWKNLADRETKIAAADVGQEVEAEPLKVSVRKGGWFQDIPQLYRLKPGQRALLVSADVTNQTKQVIDRLDVQTAFRIDAKGLVDPITDRHADADKVQPHIIRASDALRGGALQPGLPTRMALIWVQDGSYPVPDRVKLVIRKQKYRASALDGSMGYFDAAPAYEITVPLTEMKLGQ